MTRRLLLLGFAILLGPAPLARPVERTVVTIRVINGRDGKPLTRLPIFVTFYRKKLRSTDMGAVPNVQGEVREITDREGKVTVGLPEPQPEVIGFSAGVVGCSSGLFDTGEVLAKGVVPRNLCDRKRKLEGTFQPRAGEAVVFARLYSNWDLLGR